MTIPSRLLLCKKCKHLNTRTSLALFSPNASPYFCVCNCSSCHEVWFLCLLHKRRWNASNQFAATQHFKDVTISHPPLNVEHNSNTNNHTNLSENTENDDAIIENDNNKLDIEDQGTMTSHRNNFSYMSQNSQQYFNLF